MGFTPTEIGSLKLLVQTYVKDPLPQGVIMIKQPVFPDDQGGWFKETLRQDESGQVLALLEQKVSFKIRQSNTSYLAPQGKRFWHIHPTKPDHPGQNEIWSVNGSLNVGFVDLRSDSTTFNLKAKVVLAPDRAVYIPAGVAHGFFNPNYFAVTLTYFTDQYFVADDHTQEHRIDSSTMPYDFVLPEIL